jgi:hypothetical protein
MRVDAQGFEAMGLNKAKTRPKLIDPALYAQGWTDDPIKR